MPDGTSSLTPVPTYDERIAQYSQELVAREDEAQARARRRAVDAGLPPIAISNDEGKILELCARLVRARRILEVGTLAGYSTLWLARGLEPNGRIVTIERDPRHAQLARSAFRDGGVEDRVELIQGAALDIMARLEGPFDIIFLDADKEPLPEYFRGAVALLRPGGLLLCDNTFFHGRVIDRADRKADVEGVREYNRLAAQDSRLVSAIIPVRDGLMVSLKVRD